ncbi:MAG: hypothetical protein LH628_20090 [Microcoleus sp. CAN_BIN18]|nr:hypothetical protein [Microcoleus sp. CAN_BIN18]
MLNLLMGYCLFDNIVIDTIYEAIGNDITNCVPEPDREFTSIAPPCFSTTI